MKKEANNVTKSKHSVEGSSRFVTSSFQCPNIRVELWPACQSVHQELIYCD